MNPINIWAARWSTGYDVLVADYKIKEHNELTIQSGEGAGTYYLSGAFARQFPTEQMLTKAGKEITVRVIPLTEVRKEVLYGK